MTDILAAAAAASVATYFFDPDNGSRRRAAARDKMVSALDDLGRASETLASDMRIRARELAADARRLDVMQERWSPSTRALAGTLGATLVGTALGRPSLLTALLGIGGAAMITRAGRNRSFLERKAQRAQAELAPLAPLPDRTPAL